MGFLKKLGNVVKAGITAPLDVATLGSFSGSWTGQKQQNDANKMAMQAWNLANDYNHPIQQMQRLKQAGLNPLLVYGSGSVAGNTTSQPSLTGGGVSTSTEGIFRGLNSIIGLAQGKANIENTQAQARAAGASAALSGAQASNVQAQTAVNEAKSEFARRSEIADIDYKEALTRNLEMQNKKGFIDVGRAVYEASSAKSRAEMDALDAAFYRGLGGKGFVGTGLNVLGHMVRRY